MSGTEDARRVLVVDDDTVSRLMVKHMLSAIGMSVTACTGVDEALAMLQSGSFDLIVCDYLMPERTGLDLLEAIHPSPAPFVLLTGVMEQDELGDDRVFGVSAYLTKPVSTDELSVVVEKLVGQPVT